MFSTTPTHPTHAPCLVPNTNTLPATFTPASHQQPTLISFRLLFNPVLPLASLLPRRPLRRPFALAQQRSLEGSILARLLALPGLQLVGSRMVAPSDAMVDEYMAAMQTNATDGMRRSGEERGGAGKERRKRLMMCLVCRVSSCVVRVYVLTDYAEALILFLSSPSSSLSSSPSSSLSSSPPSGLWKDTMLQFVDRELRDEHSVARGYGRRGAKKPGRCVCVCCAVTGHCAWCEVVKCVLCAHC